MRTPYLGLAAALLMLAATALPSAQTAGLERLPADVLDVTPPSARVRGTLGSMTAASSACRTVPLDAARRRIVDIAVQEWAFFGFGVVDQTEQEIVAPRDNPASRPEIQARPRTFRGRRWLSPEQGERVAASIAGYWSVTPEGAWIVQQQNADWKADGPAARWNAPWSAAFISWVMCEAGLGSTASFRYAIAHHSYIDQAIRARDGRGPQAAFVAYDAGEAPVAPGDLLCSSRRPAYRSLAERRRQMGEGARSHCDIVVKLDAANDRILAIGGNVRGSVSLKLLPATGDAQGRLRPLDPSPERPIFAHLRLRAAPVAAHALDASPALTEAGCRTGGVPAAVRQLAALPAAPTVARC